MAIKGRASDRLAQRNALADSGPACAGDGDAMPSAIDSKAFPLDTLTPHLSPYGRSLLLGEVTCGCRGD